MIGYAADSVPRQIARHSSCDAEGTHGANCAGKPSSFHSCVVVDVPAPVQRRPGGASEESIDNLGTIMTSGFLANGDKISR